MNVRFRLWYLIILTLSLLLSGFTQAQDDSAEISCENLRNSPVLVIIDIQFIETDTETYCQVSGLTGQIHYKVKLPVSRPMEWSLFDER